MECEWCGSRMTLFDGDALAVVLFELSRQRKDDKSQADHEAISFWSKTAVKINICPSELSSLWKARWICFNFDCIEYRCDTWGC